jgi:hypothetical protein
MHLKTSNGDLFFARAYYFTFMGGWGFILPFINLFYISLGLSGTQIGTIGSVGSIVGLIVSPIIVTEIKKRPQARGILQVSLILTAINYTSSRPSNRLPGNYRDYVSTIIRRLGHHANFRCHGRSCITRGGDWLW